MEKNEYHGGSSDWWPPSGDHVVLYKLNPIRFSYFDRFIANWNGVKVLDVGCGGGYTCEFLARREAVVFGTDIMTESLRQAREHSNQEHLSVQYLPCTIEKLPFENNSVDLVTCFDVLEHIADKDRTIQEIYRVLKPNGWFFFDTFNKTIWSKLFIIWMGEMIIRLLPKKTHFWPWFIRPDKLALLLEVAGFSTVEYGGIRLARKSGAKKKTSLVISPEGNKSIIYFGAARKPGSMFTENKTVA